MSASAERYLDRNARSLDYRSGGAVASEFEHLEGDFRGCVGGMVGGRVGGMLVARSVAWLAAWSVAWSVARLAADGGAVGGWSVARVGRRDRGIASCHLSRAAGCHRSDCW